MSSSSDWVVCRCAEGEEDFDDLGVYTLGLGIAVDGADPEDGPALMLQQSEPLDEDGVSVTIEPSQATAYVAVVGAVLGEGSMALVLTAEAAALLGLPARLELGLDLADPERDLLRSSLARLGLLA